MARILIAEDDAAMRQFLALALTRAGHGVDLHENGLAALAALENNGDYDLLLTDIVMPGMDGIELAQKAAEQAPGLKIMFITGFSAVAEQQRAAPQAAKILSKPFHLKDLVDQIEHLLAA